MSAPINILEALDWALNRNENGNGEHLELSRELLAAARSEASMPASERRDTLTSHQERVLEEICTICNTMRKLTSGGAACAPTIAAEDVLHAAQMAFERAGALADSMIDGAVVGSLSDWMGAEMAVDRRERKEASHG